MTSTYQWQISIPPENIAQTLAVGGVVLQNVYMALDWRLIGVDQTNTYISDLTYGHAALDPPDPASFIEAPVPADTVVEWLKAALGEDQISALKTRVDADLTAQAAFAAARVIVPAITATA